MASKEVNANVIFNLHLSSVLAITATPPPRLSWQGLWTITYPGGSSSAMVQFDGFHISVKARTSRPLSIIRSLMNNALLQTKRAFNNPMVIFADASMGVNSASMGVNSAEDISHDLDFGCHILYLNKDFLTLRLSLWEWHRDLNSAVLYLRHAGACIAWDWQSSEEICHGVWATDDLVWQLTWDGEWSTAWLSTWRMTGGTADGLVWCLLCVKTEELTWLWRAGAVSTAEGLVWWPIWGAADVVWYWFWAKAGKEPICLVWHSSWAAVDSAADGLMWHSLGPTGVTSVADSWVARHWLLHGAGDRCKPV